jgi:hypothetical protein
VKPNKESVHEGQDEEQGNQERNLKEENCPLTRTQDSELPFSGKNLSKTTNETGHNDDGDRKDDSDGIGVVHVEDEGGTREGEETERPGLPMTR